MLAHRLGDTLARRVEGRIREQCLQPPELGRLALEVALHPADPLTLRAEARALVRAGPAALLRLARRRLRLGLRRGRGRDLLLQAVQVQLVVTLERSDAARLHLDDAVGDAADQVTVVGDQDQRTLVCDERLLQRVTALDVQVVRRLVHAQQVVGRDEQLRERKARALAAGEDRHRLVHVVAGEQEPPQEVARAEAGVRRDRALELLHHAVAGIQRLDLMLGEVPDERVRAEPPFAGLRLQRAGQQLQQGGLAGAVRPHERYLLAPLDRHVQIAVHLHVPVCEVHTGELHHHAAGARRRGEPQAHRAAAARRRFDPLELVQLLDARLHLLRLRVLVAEALDEPLGLCDLPPLVLGGRLRLLGAQLALLHERREVPGVGNQERVLDLHDPCRDPVHEVAVVGDEDHRPLVGAEEPLEPDHGLQVQMIRGLV